MNSPLEQVKPVDGQCGTCRFAAGFDFGSSPSGPEDGVHCNSREHAIWMDEQNDYNYNVQELDEYGFMDLFRLEVLAEEDYRCPHWEKA